MFFCSKNPPTFYEIKAGSPTIWDHARCGDRWNRGRQGQPKAPWGQIPTVVAYLERSWQGRKQPAHTGNTLPRLGNPLLLITSAQAREKIK